MNFQERKHQLIGNLIHKYDNFTYTIKRVGSYNIGDTVISNNGFVGRLIFANIVFGRIFCQIELYYNGQFFMHHFVDSKDLTTF